MSLVSRYLEPALLERLNHLSLSAQRVVEGATIGVHRSPVKGASVDFRQHRFYVPGDEPRRLDWRLLARTDRPFVREYDEETNLRALLLLDASGSMGYGEESSQKFQYAARMIAALSYLMLGQTESVGLATVGGQLDAWLAPRPGTAQLSRIIDTLERAAAKGQSELANALHTVAERLGRRSLVIVLSDFFAPITPIRQGLAHLVHERHEVLLLRILHRDEREFPFRNWSRFNGLEGEKPRLCEPAMMRRTYLDHFQKHAAELQAAANALHVEFHEFLTDTPVADALTGFLARRSLRI